MVIFKFAQLPEQMRISLDVNVAKGASHGAHDILDCNWCCIHSKINEVVKSTISARRRVIQSDCSRDGILSVLNVLILPDPPGSINLGVMKEESGVARRGENVSSWITSDCKVSTGMYPIESSGEIALHDCLEPVNVGILFNERGRIRVGCPLGRYPA